MSTCHDVGEQSAQSGGGKVIDPVLPTAKVDNIPGNEASFMRFSKVKLGTVPQANHKALPNR